MKTTVLYYRYVVPIYLFLLALYLAGTVQAQKAPVPPPDASSFNNRLAAAPLLFTENKGQVADRAGNPRPDVLFTARSAKAKIYLTATGIHYQFEKTVLPEGYEPDDRKVKDQENQEALRNQIKTQTSRFTLSLKGANPTPHIRKEAQNEYTENFYLANCAVTGVHTYERLVYENVYPGIDWVIYSKAKGLEYDFIVHPGADPNLIKLDVKDAKKVSIAADGGLVMTTELGEVKEAAPVSYSGNTEIATAFSQEADGTIGFAVDRWDKSKDLKIDPSVTWATYYGGSSDYDEGNSCTVDASGNIYLAGQTTSTSNIASGGFQNIYGGGNFDAFLVKFNSNGARIWATYYGGSGIDIGFSCTSESSGGVYMAGQTTSTSGISFNGFQNTIGYPGYEDAFLVKFSSTGARIWATYYGGFSWDYGRTCTVDALGNVFLAGNTLSPTDIASGGFQNNLNASQYSYSDAFLVKFNSSGARIWATYYGGTGEDIGYSCVADVLGNVYLAGSTYSSSGIASGGFQNNNVGVDAFLVKFNNSGARIWATYYGGFGTEKGYSCAVDPSGSVYLAGTTESMSNIASNGFQNNIGSSYFADAFLVKFSSSGARIWATYYGGGLDEDGYITCIVDTSNNVYLSGKTNSDAGIAYSGVQNIYGGGNFDAFLVKFNSSGARIWATYYGGSNSDYSNSCAVDISGNILLVGTTSSYSGIAFGGFQNNYGGGSMDAFLAKIDGSFSSASFTSVTNGNWNNPAIWSGGVVPSASSVVIINNAVTLTANASCYSLTVNPSGSVTVSPGINLTILH